MNMVSHLWTFIPYSHFRPIICFPLTCKTSFFFSDPKERGWKVVLRKDHYGKGIIKIIQTDLMEFDMFRFDNINDYTCLQAPISIQESIQPATIVGGFIVASLNLDLVAHEGEDGGVDSAEEYATSCDSDG